MPGSIKACLMARWPHSVGSRRTGRAISAQSRHDLGMISARSRHNLDLAHEELVVRSRHNLGTISARSRHDLQLHVPGACCIRRTTSPRAWRPALPPRWESRWATAGGRVADFLHGGPSAAPASGGHTVESLQNRLPMLRFGVFLMTVGGADGLIVLRCPRKRPVDQRGSNSRVWHARRCGPVLSQA